MLFTCPALVRAERLQNVVGLMGSMISDAQLWLLKRFRYVVLILDGLKAGREGTGRCSGKDSEADVQAILLLTGVQPDTLSRPIRGPAYPYST